MKCVYLDKLQCLSKETQSPYLFDVPATLSPLLSSYEIRKIYYYIYMICYIVSTLLVNRGTIIIVIIDPIIENTSRI